MNLFNMILAYGFLCLLLLFNSLQAKSIRMEVLPRHVLQHIEGVTYESLRDVFQTYPVDRRNTNQTWKWLGTCDELSGHREITHTDSGPTQKLVSKPCYSVLQNCRHDVSMAEIVHFCVSTDQHRRYEYMNINMEVGHKYGRNITCPSSEFEKYFSFGVYYPCLCDCESSKKEKDRYFSLGDVTADVGKVVTGVRLRKVDHVFYIQIQQVELGWNKLIRGQAKWKEVRKLSQWELLSSNVSEYYKQKGNDDDLLKFHKNNLVYAVTSEQNTILLDDLVGGPNEVLTGLRFRQVGQDLRLEIQVTPFDDVTAKLNRSASRWLHNDIDKSRRIEVTLTHAKVPGKKHSSLSYGYREFVKFQVSDFKTDLGQTTVPFIAITDVNMDIPQIVTGAGIFYRGSSDSAGFIALKMILSQSTF